MIVKNRREVAFLTIFIFLMAGTLFILLEASIRAYLAAAYNSEVLLYGTEYCCGPGKGAFFDKRSKKQLMDGKYATVTRHANDRVNYSKYFPNEELTDHVRRTSESFAVKINSHGFRGRDYAVEKRPGVVRIVTLGASSTFGYGNKDEETYPHMLERLLNERAGEARCGDIEAFEVINLAIPHLHSENIKHLYLQEGAVLRPDAVTFYEGANDSSRDGDRVHWNDRWTDVPLYYKVVRKLKKWFVSAALVSNLIDYDVFAFSAKDADVFFAGKAGRFLDTLAEIREEVTSQGAYFLVASQQAKSLLVDVDEIRGLTYAEEVELVREKLADTNSVTMRELYFLAHNEIMQGLRDWVDREQIPFVDVLRELDERRDVLTSWVHLTDEGNRKIAGLLGDSLLERLCPADQ